MYVGTSCIFGYYVIKWPPCQKPVRGLKCTKNSGNINITFYRIDTKNYYVDNLYTACYFDGKFNQSYFPPF